MAVSRVIFAKTIDYLDSLLAGLLRGDRQTDRPTDRQTERERERNTDLNSEGVCVASPMNHKSCGQWVDAQQTRACTGE